MEIESNTFQHASKHSSLTVAKLTRLEAVFLLKISDYCNLEFCVDIPFHCVLLRKKRFAFCLDASQ